MAGRPAKVWTGTEWVPLAVAQAVDTDGITAASAAAIYLRQDTASATYISETTFTAANQLISSSESSTPITISIQNDQIILSNQVFN